MPSRKRPIIVKTAPVEAGSERDLPSIDQWEKGWKDTLHDDGDGLLRLKILKLIAQRRGWAVEDVEANWDALRSQG